MDLTIPNVIPLFRLINIDLSESSQVMELVICDTAHMFHSQSLPSFKIAEKRTQKA